MEQLSSWITPALVLGLFAVVRFMFRDLKENMNKQIGDLKTGTEKRIDDLKSDTSTRIEELRADMKSQFAETGRRFDEMNQRFDQINRELADNRERMAKLEGSLEGFLAGRRDRDAA